MLIKWPEKAFFIDKYWLKKIEHIHPKIRGCPVLSVKLVLSEHHYEIMNFGRLQHISDNTDITLPTDHAATASILKKTETSSDQSLYIGCPIWSENGWVGKIYPNDAKEKDFLKYYAQQFNSIELNTTHYRIPAIPTIQRWKAASSKGFKFCPKIPQEISHAKMLKNVADLTLVFCENIRQLGNSLGTVFLQLPPYFSPLDVEALKTFIDYFPNDISLAVEFRHPEWFSNKAAMNAIFEFMEARSVSSVITDVLGRRDVLHQRLSTKTAFIRFTANNLHPTDYKRMDDWILRLNKWLDQGLETLYFFVHTPEKSLCSELVNYMIDGLNNKRKTNLVKCRINQPLQQSTLNFN